MSEWGVLVYDRYNPEDNLRKTVNSHRNQYRMNIYLDIFRQE